MQYQKGDVVKINEKVVKEIKERDMLDAWYKALEERNFVIEIEDIYKYSYLIKDTNFTVFDEEIEYKLMTPHTVLRKGDKVKIRSWDDMGAEFGLDHNREIPMSRGYRIAGCMKPYCDTIVTVSCISPLDYEIGISGLSDWGFTPDMFVSEKQLNQMHEFHYFIADGLGIIRQTVYCKYNKNTNKVDRGVASCNPYDKYNEELGIQIAKGRCESAGKRKSKHNKDGYVFEETIYHNDEPTVDELNNILHNLSGTTVPMFKSMSCSSSSLESSWKSISSTNLEDYFNPWMEQKKVKRENNKSVESIPSSVLSESAKSTELLLLFTEYWQNMNDKSIMYKEHKEEVTDVNDVKKCVELLERILKKLDNLMGISKEK